MDQHKSSGEVILLPLEAGTVAGLVATIPMTLFMALMHQLLPKWQRYALPPVEITEEITQRAHMRDNLNRAQVLGISLAAHLSYGASMGSLYVTLTRKIKLPALLKGAVFGLLVWTVSYLGWLPLGRFSAAAPAEEPQRNVLMVISHLIWGSVTGIVADQMHEHL